MTAVSRAYFSDMSQLIRALFADINSQIVSQIPRWTAEEAELTTDTVDEELDFLIARLQDQYSSPALLLQYQDAAQEAGPSVFSHPVSARMMMPSSWT